MTRITLVCLWMAALLTACASFPFVPATPTATSTPTSTATGTFTPQPTATPTSLPSPTTRPSPVATETVSLPVTSVKSSEQFEQWVGAGLIKCQGAESTGPHALTDFYNKAVASGAVPKAQYVLVSGIPSSQSPTQCVYLMVFEGGETTIIYKDGETRKYAKLPVIE